MIQTKVLKHFIASYRSFVTYTRNIKHTTNNISQVRAIYVQFAISSTLSIGSVIILTHIRHINFHIV